eukprot:4776350-Karenia_brevis.AAC.1
MATMQQDKHSKTGVAVVMILKVLDESRKAPSWPQAARIGSNKMWPTGAFDGFKNASRWPQ